MGGIVCTYPSAFETGGICPAGSFPDSVERISELLKRPEYLADLNERLEGLAEACQEDKEVMRFYYYRPDKVLAQFQKFAKEAVPYQAREDTEAELVVLCVGERFAAK